jgi:glycosyltransferase involved in cell wall biosynthesis
MKEQEQNMSKRRLTVSVIMPAYNRADLIEEAIDSCLNQTQVPDEIVVVDDGSTDNTAEVLAKYGRPVVVVRQSNQGVAAARNTAIAKATGDVFVFLDSDDRLLPRCIERTVAVLEKQPEIGVLHRDVYIIDQVGNRVILCSEHDRCRPPADNVFAKLACRNVINLTSTAIRRSAVEGIAFDTSITPCEDYDLWRQLASKCPFYYQDEPLAEYRNHGGQATVNSAERMREGTLKVQFRIMAMPEFKKLTRRERAMAYSTCGNRHAEGKESGAARRLFLKAIVTDPSYLSAYAQLGLSLLGNRVLMHALNRRRQVLYGHVGEHISARIGKRRKQEFSAVTERDGRTLPPGAAAVGDSCVMGTEQ